MIWEEVILRKKIVLSKDRLGNDKIELENPGRKIIGRLTQWTSEDIQVYGRDLTESSRKLITPSKYITKDMVVEIQNELYEIKDIKKLERFTFLIIKRWRQWQNSI